MASGENGCCNVDTDVDTAGIVRLAMAGAGGRWHVATKKSPKGWKRVKTRLMEMMEYGRSATTSSAARCSKKPQCFGTLLILIAVLLLEQKFFVLSTLIESATSQDKEPCRQTVQKKKKRAEDV